MCVLWVGMKITESYNENTHFQGGIGEPKRPFGIRSHNYSRQNLGLWKFFAKRCSDWLKHRTTNSPCYMKSDVSLREIFDFFHTMTRVEMRLLRFSVGADLREKSSIVGRLLWNRNIFFSPSDYHSTDKMYCVKGKKEKRMCILVVWVRFLFSVVRQMLMWKRHL